MRFGRYDDPKKAAHLFAAKHKLDIKERDRIARELLSLRNK